VGARVGVGQNDSFFHNRNFAPDDSMRLAEAVPMSFESGLP